MEPSVRTTLRGHALVIELHRPAARNALNLESLTALRDTLAEVDPERVAGVVLTGSDPAFCAGLDLNELAADPAAFGGFEVPRWLREVPVPVVAAVNGPAVTGGLELALACDLRFASTEAWFADTHALVGVVPGWGLTAALPALVGVARATELSLSGRYVDGKEAVRIGLAERVVAHQELIDVACAYVEQVAVTDPATRATILELYRSGRDAARSGALAAEAVRSDRWFELPPDEHISDRAAAVRSHGRNELGRGG